MGGYVKTACLISADMDRMAQLRVLKYANFKSVTVSDSREILKASVSKSVEKMWLNNKVSYFSYCILTMHSNEYFKISILDLWLTSGAFLKILHSHHRSFLRIT